MKFIEFYDGEGHGSLHTTIDPVRILFLVNISLILFFFCLTFFFLAGSIKGDEGRNATIFSLPYCQQSPCSSWASSIPYWRVPSFFPSSLLLVEGCFIPEDARHSNPSQPQGPLPECAFIFSNITFPRREVHPQLIPSLVGQQQIRRSRRPRWQVKKQQETLRMKPSYFRCNKISWSHFWTLHYTM